MTKRTGMAAWLLAGAVALGGVAGGVSGAVAQQAPAAPPPQHQPLLTPDDRAAMAQIFWHRMQERLGLNDQQVADIRAIVQNQRSASQPDVQALIAARKQLRTLLQQANADPTDIQAAATQVKAQRDKLFDQRLQTQLAIRSKLTQEQLAKWAELRQGMGHRRMWQRGAFNWGRS